MDKWTYAERTEAGVWVITDADWPLSVRIRRWALSYRAGATVISPASAFTITVP